MYRVPFDGLRIAANNCRFTRFGELLHEVVASRVVKASKVDEAVADELATGRRRMAASAPRPRAVAQLRRLPARFWARSAVFAVLAAGLIALPARLVPNDLFRRMTPTRPLDYVFWVAGSALVGVLLALPREQRAELPGAAGGVATLLAVSCPVCNKVVVALIGVSGALDVFAPFQPALGIGALVLMAWSFRRALVASGECQIPKVEAAP